MDVKVTISFTIGDLDENDLRQCSLEELVQTIINEDGIHNILEDCDFDIVDIEPEFERHDIRYWIPDWEAL